MILVTGASGFVGRKLMQALPGAVAAPSLRGKNQDEVKKIIEASNAGVIIHTAAISDVGACEKDPAGSYEANVLLPVYLANAAAGRKLVCFSSDQVYTGSKDIGPYREEEAEPANVYARHKLEMEKRVLDLLPTAVLLRAEWMYDFVSPKGNYFKQLLQAEQSVAYSSRQYRGLTYLREVAENMPKVMLLEGGVYNFGSETDQSIYEITKAFLAFLRKSIPIEDVEPRHNLWMNCEKAKRRGILFSSVADGLKKCAVDAGLITNREVVKQ